MSCWRRPSLGTAGAREVSLASASLRESLWILSWVYQRLTFDLLARVRVQIAQLYFRSNAGTVRRKDP